MKKRKYPPCNLLTTAGSFSSYPITELHVGRHTKTPYGVGGIGVPRSSGRQSGFVSKLRIPKQYHEINRISSGTPLEVGSDASRFKNVLRKRFYNLKKPSD